ncbi:amino acid permease [bacterium]|nr:amino acid permease [bacterium]MBP5783716.1 amino acid permease [bacterium]
MTNVSQFVIFGSFIINYTGIEQTASTIRRMKNPGRDYPIGAMVVCAIMITFGILCSVAIVLTVNINGTVLYKGYQTGFTLNNGIYLAFYHIIIGKNSFGIDNAEAQGTFKFLAFLTLMGAMGQTNAVMIEPSTGVHGAFVDMRFPKFILKVNKLDVHYNILIMQCLLTIM